MRGEADVRLLKTVGRPPREAAGRAGRREGGEGRPYTPPDADLFEALRALRRAMAEERGVPPYVIFSDASLREMARERPTTEAEFLAIKGVGQHKLTELGPRFLARIRAHLTPSPENPPRGPQ
jgi:ATP-dependent DNA helicase RecQ